VWILAYLDFRQRDEEESMMEVQLTPKDITSRNPSNLVRFGVMGLGQLALGLLTIWAQKTVSDWLVNEDIKKYKPNPIRGFQKTPMV
jgi:hypothetical protein